MYFQVKNILKNNYIHSQIILLFFSPLIFPLYNFTGQFILMHYFKGNWHDYLREKNY